MEPTLQTDPLPTCLPHSYADCSPGLIRELWLFVRATGKWWLVPILVVLLLLGTVLLLSASAVGPFMYTLF